MVQDASEERHIVYTPSPTLLLGDDDKRPRLYSSSLFHNIAFAQS
jgi:hypothetical protein